MVWSVENGAYYVRLFRAVFWCPSGGGSPREAGGIVAESLVGSSSTPKRTVACAVGRISTSFGEDGGQLDHRRSRGMLNHCVQKSKAQTGRC